MKVGIIGAGQMGWVHWKAHAANGVQVRAAADVDERRAGELARQGGARTFQDWRRLLAGL